MNFVKKIRQLFRFFLNAPRRHFLNKQFDFNLDGITIFSNNCIAGFLYSNCKTKYYSPTIGLQIPIPDFFKFVNNYKIYTGLSLVEASPFQDVFSNLGGGKVTFPCANLGDVRVLFQHEKVFEEAQKKWRRRIDRINDDKIVIIMFVEKQLMTKDVLKEFELIHFPKLLISNSPLVLNCDNCFFINIPDDKKWFSHKNKSVRFFEEYNFKSFFETTNKECWGS